MAPGSCTKRRTWFAEPRALRAAGAYGENALRTTVIALQAFFVFTYVTEEVCRCSRSRCYGMIAEFVRKDECWNLTLFISWNRELHLGEERRCLPKKGEAGSERERCQQLSNRPARSDRP